MSKLEAAVEEQQELRFFLDGYKPAILTGNNEKSRVKRILIEKSYPFAFVSEGPRNREPRCIIFFQKSVSRDQYIQQMSELYIKSLKGEEVKMGDTMIVDGLALGFPPSAVHSFMEANKGSKKHKMMINYYGLHFVTMDHLVEENLQWLKETYPVPDDYEGRIVIEDLRPRHQTFRVKDIDAYVKGGELNE